MKIIGYVAVAGRRTKRFSNIVYDCLGNAVLNRQRFSNSIQEAVEKTREDMKEYPFSTAVIYVYDRNHKPYTYRAIDCAGKVLKPNEID